MTARLALALACVTACNTEPKPAPPAPLPQPRLELPLVPIQRDAPAPIPPPPDARLDAAAAARAPTWREPLAAAFHSHPPALPAVSGDRVAVYSGDPGDVSAPFGVDFYRGGKLEESLPILVADDDGLDWGIGLLERRGDAITAKLAGFEPWQPAPASLARNGSRTFVAPDRKRVLVLGPHRIEILPAP
ncbi:MAG TPA: hypothetical protein VGF94_15815 [Kofleriaceae bacterium]|jgi:hypothetical protein